MTRHRRQWVFAASLFIAEIFAISFGFDAAREIPDVSSPAVQNLLAATGSFAKFLIVFLAALMVLSFERWPQHLEEALELDINNRSFTMRLTIHLIAYCLFYVLSALLFTIPSLVDEDNRALLAGPWLLMGLICVITLAWALAPWTFWRTALHQERYAIGLSLCAGAVAWVFGFISTRLWQGLGDLTLSLVHKLLTLFFTDVHVDFSLRILGVGDFLVEVGQPCSGYEGIGMITVFTSLYLYVFRREFHFPKAFWLFPIGIFAIWLFNLIRIAVLVTIGARISPEVAINGFHSQAGWLSFLAVSLGLLTLAYRTTFFTNQTKPNKYALTEERANLAALTLLPLTAVFSAILITGAFTDQSAINWFYPLPVAAGIAALLYCWSQYNLPSPKLQLWPLLCGAAVFAMWIALHPDDPDLDHEMGALLTQTSTGVSLAWIIARVFGSVLIIPVVEELVFRGYLLSRLAKQDVSLTGPIPFSWLALILSSVVFGMLHQAWLAGIIAGFAYATLRYRSSDIWAPIIAHVVSNGLIALYVLTTGTWSLW